MSRSSVGEAIVVADASPLNSLVLIETLHVLPENLDAGLLYRSFQETEELGATIGRVTSRQGANGFFTPKNAGLRSG